MTSGNCCKDSYIESVGFFMKGPLKKLKLDSTRGKNYFQEIDNCLTPNGYSKEKVRGNFYWRWFAPNKLDFYVWHGKLGVNKLFIDAALTELKDVLVRVDGIVPPDRGMTPNSKFELFQLHRMFPDGSKEFGAWKFSFRDEPACNIFLDVCKAYAEGGIESAQVKALEFEQVAPPKTAKSVLTESRIGQAKFRKDLLKYWKICSVTGLSVGILLRASHIKPWSAASPSERLDPFNGLLLSPNLDALFDEGLISFSAEGLILISSRLECNQYKSLGLEVDMKLRRVNGAHSPYLAYHRTNIFKP